MTELDKDVEQRFDEHELFSRDIKVFDPINGCSDPKCCDPFRIINYELKQFLAKELAAAKEEGARKAFVLEILPSVQDVQKAISDDEGNHTQQVAYSSYHGALTQVCFNCKKIRTNLNA